MPGGDRTGPLGEGPLTGRRLGYCTGNEQPEYVNPRSNWRMGAGRGFRGGFGYGRGPGPRFYYGPGTYYQGRSPDVSEKTMIENEIRILKDQLSSLEDRLSKIKEE